MTDLTEIFQNPENIIHQLFLALGCNLDYVPEHKWQAFTLGLQFLAALWFIIWFVKFLFTLMKDMWRL